MVYLTIIAVVLFILGFVAYASYRSRQTFTTTWNRMSRWEKACLWSGAVLFFVVPLLSDPPSGAEYIVGVFSKLVTALANGLFFAGAVAFLQRSHEIEEEIRSIGRQTEQNR